MTNTTHFISAKNYYVLDSITPKKVNEAIASGKTVYIEEHHVDTRCKTHYHYYAEIDGTAYKMTCRGYNQVRKATRGSYYGECTNYGGYEGYAYNC